MRTSFYTVFVSAVTADGSGISAVLVFIQLSRCAYDFADPAPTGTEYVEKYLLVSDHFTDIAGLPETDSMGIMGIRTLRLL